MTPNQPVGSVTKRTITDLSGSSPYLIRWSLWLPCGLSLKLHQILRADDDRCCHDHPFWMLRVILWGGYTEIVRTRVLVSRPEGPYVRHVTEETRFDVFRRKPWRPWAPWRVYWCSGKFAHRITRLTRGENWSLVLCGPNSGSWGFFTTRGWMSWRRFVAYAKTSRVLICEDGGARKAAQDET